MKEYPKIQSVWKRDPANKMRTFLEGEWTTPELALLAEAPIWTATEKVDGTNVRVHWDGSQVRFGGRTDNAQMPVFLMEKLQDLFPPEKMLEVLGPKGGLILFGEGYGAKIQKGGGDYGDPSFILFDIAAEDGDRLIWFTQEGVYQYAQDLGIKAVPIIADSFPLTDAIKLAKEGFTSQLRSTAPEGLVLRPEIELNDRMGRRIITKVKLKDFPKR